MFLSTMMITVRKISHVVCAICLLYEGFPTPCARLRLGSHCVPHHTFDLDFERRISRILRSILILCANMSGIAGKA
jgi:hypothetical protein